MRVCYAERLIIIQMMSTAAIIRRTVNPIQNTLARRSPGVAVGWGPRGQR
jgi:hypothetical protein